MDEKTSEEEKQNAVVVHKLPTGFDEAISRLKDVYEIEKKELSKLIEQWDDVLQHDSGDSNKADLARLWKYVLMTERETKNAEFWNFETLLKIVQRVMVGMNAIEEELEKRLEHTVTKDDAVAIVKRETDSFGRNLLRRIKEREEETKRKWIGKKFGKGDSK